jgi:ketosteroid isomerase-like protein
MSQENVELTRQGYDAVNRRDLDAFLALMDEDVQAVSILVAMEGDYRGHDGIRRWWDDLLDIFPDYAVDVVEVRDLGDVTVAALCVRGHGAGSDTPFERPIWMLTKWREEKVVCWRSYETEAEALEAVGLREST